MNAYRLNVVCEHPTANQVAKTDNGFEVHEHMWSNDVFTAYVDDMVGKGCWKENMQPRMKQIVTWSLLCAQVPVPDCDWFVSCGFILSEAFSVDNVYYSSIGKQIQHSIYVPPPPTHCPPLDYCGNHLMAMHGPPRLYALQ